MIELFADIPEEIKKQNELIINFIFNNLTPSQINIFLKNYINTCNSEEEKDFINFLAELKIAELEGEKND